MKALIIGLGSIGRRHGRNLSELGIGVSGFDPKKESRDWFKREVGSAKVFDSFDLAIEDGADFVVIASPNRFHLEQALRCARSHINLFIEKPMSTSAEGIDELSGLVKENDLVCMLASNWKFHPMLMRLHQIIRSNELGGILAVHSIGGQYLPDWHPWEDYRQMYSSRNDLGGGVLLDCHDIDYLTWLLGPVSIVNCQMFNTGTLEIDTNDLAAIMLQFESGALGTLQIDYLQRPNARRVHITGSVGTAIWDFSDKFVKVYTAADKLWETHKEPENYNINAMYVDQMKDYINCIAEKRIPLTSIDQARHVMNIFDSLVASSAQSGRAMEVKA